MKTINNKHILNKSKKQKAFISIFAIFFSAVITSVLVGMFGLLIKQIELLNMDSSSFQAYYVADSAFECFTAREKVASGTTSYLLPANYTSFPGCQSGGDTTVTQIPVDVGGRATSTWKYAVQTDSGSFCGYVVAGREVSQSSQVSNQLIISGQSKPCSDTTNNKIIERGIDFFY